MRNYFYASILFYAACSDAPVQTLNDSAIIDSITVMKDTTLAKPQSGILDTIAVKSSVATLKSDSAKIAAAIKDMVVKGYAILDTMTGNLNRDNYLDMLTVVESDAKFVADDEPRSVLIFVGTASSEMKFEEQNDNVVLCRDCGGVYGDPYDGLAIKNGYFSVEHYGGSAWRWTRIITFKYNESQKTWLLHRDAGVSYNVFEPDETETENVYSTEHYGKMKFEDYNSM